jgi:DNA-binding GntR family transcriptional regulator
MTQITPDKVELAGDSVVERVYEQLKTMAIGYAFKPGERLNEVELARRLSASRTPLREALNRLNSEGLLRFAPGKGYYCRDLDVNEVFSLYELRKAIEIAAIRLAIRRAKDEDIDALLAFLDSTGPEPGGRSIVDLVQLDETFHQRLMAMSGNVEMTRVLNNVNARIRFVRWIDMDRGDRKKTQIEHRSVLVRLRRRDEAGCVALLEKHIDRRLDEITAALKEGYARIYMAGANGPTEPERCSA